MNMFHQILMLFYYVYINIIILINLLRSIKGQKEDLKGLTFALKSKITVKI